MVSAKPSNNKLIKHRKSFNLILIFLCLLLVFLGKFDLIVVRNLKAFFSDFLAPVTFAVNKPIKEIAIIMDDVKSATDLRSENIRFKSEIRRLKAWKNKTKNQELELLELRKLLNSVSGKRAKLVTGRVITAPGGVFANTVLLDAGLKEGIKIGQPAISSKGLVGSVINVGLNTSRILLLVDLNSMIPAYLTDSNWPLILQGQNGKLLKMKFLATDAKPIEGEIIETSGHGESYPYGITIGHVVKSFSGNYFVKPTTNFQRLTYISIITNFNSSNTILPKNEGFAPLQKPKPSFGLKGFNSKGQRKKHYREH